MFCDDLTCEGVSKCVTKIPVINLSTVMNVTDIEKSYTILCHVNMMTVPTSTCT